ncbi:ATP-binding protein [Rubrivirga sp. S365]|uniref:histidine kinase n=1 Tax=Rubrivirga litoralis TaxID=3075598 RepID=A0ABU3BNL1_9BACT|nr:MULTISPECIES: ATP-binding protein [unclassified Rubrivirga]MDT0630815.1 ATP-binding protein [Rubrivirga sp. F394]MDT7857367.1 ATP-binding protein [Rubrivirga sp. S365]
MSSARPDAGLPAPPRPAARAGGAGWRSPFGVRLALSYAALFAVSAAVLLGLAYAAYGFVLARQDAAYLRDQLGAVERVYAAGGVDGVRRYAARLQADDRGEEVLIRIAGRGGAVRLLVLPDAWRPGDVGALDGPLGQTPAVIVNARERQTLDVLARRLASGDGLQVGFSSDERDDALEALPRVFPVVAVPLVLLALLGGGVMAARALRPVRRIVATLEAITDTGDVRRRAPVEPERGELADLLRLFNRTLDRVEALVDRLGHTLDDVAHDLRTPLTAVRGTAELALRRDREPEAYRAALARVVEAAEAAQDTLDTVLDVAEAESGALHLDLAPVDLDGLARDVADLYELAASEKNVTLSADLGRGGAVRADAARLRRALANLVDNAVKYTPPGGRVTVTTGRDAGRPGGAEAWVAVRDTGAGIAPDELERVWDRLYRSERTRHERGLGLGLGLARAIAEAHGGRVTAESGVGEGSTFTLALPVDGPGGAASGGAANLSVL